MLKKVIFVCVGNVCRSPMAEAFANCYGGDVLVAESRGLAPVPQVPIETVRVMREKNIDVSKHIAKRYMPFEGTAADIVVNISEYRLPGSLPRTLMEWKVADPYGRPLKYFQKTRDDLEGRVMQLILSLRTTGRVSQML